MKTNLLITAILLAGLVFTGSALAGERGPGGSYTNTDTTIRSRSNATGSASNEGNNQTTVFEGALPSKIPNNTPSMVAPSLTTTLTETCMGSTSMAGSAAGFGLAFGSTWRDEECVRRLNARELRAMGLGPVAMELMCDNDDIRAAFERAGRRVTDLPQCQRSVDERNELAGGKAYTIPYTITTEPSDPFRNATRNKDGEDQNANGDPWASQRGGDQ